MLYFYSLVPNMSTLPKNSLLLDWSMLNCCLVPNLSTMPKNPLLLNLLRMLLF